MNTLRLKTLITFLLILILWAQPSLGQLKGNLDRYLMDSLHVSSRRVDVWTSSLNLSVEQVVIMHDGQMLFQGDSTWNKEEWRVDECLDSLIRAGELKNTLVIGIWNNYKDRHRNYFPEKPFKTLSGGNQSSLLNVRRPHSKVSAFSGPPDSDAYLRSIFEIILPRIAKKYQISGVPLYMIGSSMGGLISMYAACEYPQKLNGVACLSTHWPGIWTNTQNPVPNAFLHYLKRHRKEAMQTNWYFDHGDKTLDTLYAVHQKRVDSLFNSWEWGETQFRSRIYPGANHSENAWAMRLPQVLLYLDRSEKSK